MSQGPSMSPNPGLLDFAAGPMAVLKVGGSSRSVTKGILTPSSPVSWDILGLRANQNRITI